MPHAAVSDRQRSRAKSLRQTMTRAEMLLWRYIKAGHVDGLQFRRQAPMGAYIVDFVCHAAKIVIEVDGATHDFDSRLRQDRVRGRWLASRGYRVVRFTNDEVLSQLEGVVTVIRETAHARMRGAPPSLSLPRKGGGNPQTTRSRAASKQEQTPSLPSPASGGGGERGASEGRNRTAGASHTDGVRR
jgi:very-short-patch-repair endonuclease